MENILSMTLRMRNTVSRTIRDVGLSLNNAKSKAMSFGTMFGKSMKASKTSATDLMGTFISLKTIIIATFAYRVIQKFAGFLSSLTKIFKESETEGRKLSEVLASQGNYYSSNVSNLTKYITELQSSVAISENVLLKQAALLASYGMTAEQIKTSLLPAINLSVAKHIDLETAVNLVGKSFVGYTGTLARFGIVIDNTLSKEAKYAAVLKELNKLNGVAAGVTDTYTGKVTKIGLNWEGVKRSLGNVIAETLEHSGILNTNAKMLENWHGWLNKNKEVLGVLAGKALVGINDSLKKLNNTIKEDNFVAWLITVNSLFIILRTSVHTGFAVIGSGITNIKESIRYTVSAIKVVKAEFLGTEKEIRAARLADEQFEQKYWSGIENRWKKDLEIMKSDAEKQDDAVKKMSNAWKKADAGELWKSINEYMAKSRKEMEKQSAVTKSNIINQKKYKDEIADTFRLTQNMAQQFALATRLEQSQIKYLVEKAKTITPKGVANLGEMEKKLISSQGVLKELFSKAFEEYAGKELKAKNGSLSGGRTDVNVKIGLTDEAKEFFEINSTTTNSDRDLNFRRLAG